MSIEREADREIRSWVSEGVDRAPERFVWAALDEIERVPQRGPWRATLERLTARAQPATKLLAAAVVVAVAAVGLRFAFPSVGTGPEVRAFNEADLPGIIVWEDTMPRSWRLDNLMSNSLDVWAVPLRTAQAVANAESLPSGYLGGRLTGFTGLDTVQGIDAAFMSWGLVFESADDAAAAMPLVEHELESVEGWGYGPGQAIDLGDGGYLYSGETTAFTGPPGTNEPIASQVYLWRDGNVLLAVGGWFEFKADQLRAVAQAMDARATTIREGS